MDLFTQIMIVGNYSKRKISNKEYFFFSNIILKRFFLYKVLLKE